MNRGGTVPTWGSFVLVVGVCVSFAGLRDKLTPERASGFRLPPASEKEPQKERGSEERRDDTDRKLGSREESASHSVANHEK